MADPVKRLLVIKFGGIDDAILLVPALRALRRALGTAEIHWLCSPAIRGVTGLVPYVDHRFELDPRSPLAVGRAAARIRSMGFDAVIDFEQGSRLSPVLALLSGANVRLGFYTPGRRRLRAYTDTYWKYFARHEAHEFLGLAGMLTPVVFDPSLEIWESDSGRAEVAMLNVKRTTDGPLVVIHPGCGPHRRPREWPLTSHAVLANWLMKRHGADIWITSDPSDPKPATDLGRLLSGQAKDFGGKLSFSALVTVFSRADLVISGNSPAMHLAAALGRRQVALHGPTDPTLWGPLNSRARVVRSACDQCPCERYGGEFHRSDPSCMAKISIDEVKSAVDAAFDNPEGI